MCDGYGSPITKKDDYYFNPSILHDSECERLRVPDGNCNRAEDVE